MKAIADRYALIGHVGGKKYARHQQIDHYRHPHEHPGKGMHQQQPVAHHPRAGRAQHRRYRQGHDVAVSLNYINQPVQLAARLPAHITRQLQGGAGEQQGQHEKKGHAARNKIDQTSAHRLLPLTPQAPCLAGKQPQTIKTQRKQMAEE